MALCGTYRLQAVEDQFSPPFTFASDSGPVSVSAIDDERWLVTGQFMAGLAYHLSGNVTLTAGYRLQVIESVMFDNGQFLDNTVSHNVEVGLRFTF